MMLSIENLVVNYGNIIALKSISMQINEAEIVALIGANGAGKTTTLRTISGLLRPASGSITYNGEKIDTWPVEKIVAAGLSHVPEGRRIFPGLTVLENLKVATSTWAGRGQSIQPELEKVYRLFPKLRERTSQLGWSLSGGEQQMLAIGRAMMSRPKLLMLDEVSLGLAPNLVQDIFQTIKEINQSGLTILLIEQNANLALEYAHRVYILENGEVVMTDTAINLAKNPQIQDSYLGS
ncbi:MAG: ABC transporter ATP-binding protein [Chloroflexi bacterium GWB2_49_20]|nr:MAG: ABC transporter ATP-binding protein [Chloroflexi bacterium GWB2_49_20]OGN80339.1 MAG: ABC transporter ATP-binding protein [Chloroflexi bacterium GWC2_49_37]OGN85671.1 MAG: ABC transporter ATP-binding protein [Chloroflexi bacterium GWD2_49_16]HCC79320.1 ABC transporter ATP-binding protein [Anaerolineae bacterium]HCM96459.1 ABC transporter ATP-binding protein [Anaerolineae bacterium]